jgi:hypothetical protein
VLSSAAATHQGPDCEHKASEYFAFDLPSPRREPLFVFVLEFRFCDHHFGEMGIHTLKLERERESVKRKNREENRGGEREREKAREQKNTEENRGERERERVFFFWVNESDFNGKCRLERESLRWWVEGYCILDWEVL